MAGIENNLGVGEAQVLPEGKSMLPFAELLNQQRQQKFQRDKYNQQLQQKKEDGLYSLIGDSLNPKDFNSVIQDKVLQAQKDLAAKIKTENPSYGDMYMAAQNAAGNLAKTSQSLNQLDQQLALTRKEYASDKRIDSGAIEILARKKILDQLNKTGQVDPSVNYFDQALNENPEHALVDKSPYTLTDYLPEEKQPLSGKFTTRNSVGRTQKYDWKADNYPVYYDVKDNGDSQTPTISTRSQPSGLKDKDGNEVPMLSDDAYGRFRAKPSNVVALNLRLKQKYGDALDLQSEQAEKLRKIEAFKDVDRNKPPINKSVSDEQPIPKTTNVFNFGGAGNNAVKGNEFDRIPDNIPMLEQRNGKIYNKANEDTFTWGVDKQELPPSIHAILKSAGYDIADYDKFDLEVKDGVIQSITPLKKDFSGDAEAYKKDQKITRQDMENAQLKYNTEPLKGTQLQFGENGKRKSGRINKSPVRVEDLRKKYDY